MYCCLCCNACTVVCVACVYAGVGDGGGLVVGCECIGGTGVLSSADDVLEV